MTEQTTVSGLSEAALADLAEAGVRIVRVSYPDLHGIARGKDIPVSEFGAICGHGAAFCEAIMTVDLRHNVVAGFEHGFRDIVARPDLDTLVRIPWDPSVAWCLADLERVGTHEPYGVDPRRALRRAVGSLAELGLTAVIAPELEFYLCEPDEQMPRGYRRYVDHDSHVYTVGHVADPRGILTRMLQASVDLGLGAFAANQEYGRAQYEINLRHTSALDSADRAFRFKSLVKELAAREGLLATFIGRPWNDDEGSGFHLHLSLANAAGDNVLEDADAPDGLSRQGLQFLAGVLEHAPALMAFLNPTTNAYRRLNPEALVPSRVNWGHDNRLTLVRIPRERGAATRMELRMGDGAANPYLAYAAVIEAGLDGIRRELEPPAAVEGFFHELPEDEQGPPVPLTFPEAIAALDGDATLRAALGDELVDTYLVIKRAELERARLFVTDWEFAEYAHHL